MEADLFLNQSFIMPELKMAADTEHTLSLRLRHAGN